MPRPMGELGRTPTRLIGKLDPASVNRFGTGGRKNQADKGGHCATVPTTNGHCDPRRIHALLAPVACLLRSCFVLRRRLIVATGDSTPIPPAEQSLSRAAPSEEAPPPRPYPLLGTCTCTNLEGAFPHCPSRFPCWRASSRSAQLNYSICPIIGPTAVPYDVMPPSVCCSCSCGGRGNPSSRNRAPEPQLKGSISGTAGTHISHGH